MKHLKLFEGYFTDEIAKIKSQIDEVKKEFQKEAGEIFTQFEDEFNHEVEIDLEYTEEDNLLHAAMAMSGFERSELDKMLKSLDDVYQIARSKGMDIDFEYVVRYWQEGHYDTQCYRSEKNQTIEDFKKENLSEIQKLEIVLEKGKAPKVKPKNHSSKAPPPPKPHASVLRKLYINLSDSLSSTANPSQLQHPFWQD